MRMKSVNLSFRILSITKQQESLVRVLILAAEDSLEAWRICKTKYAEVRGMLGSADDSERFGEHLLEA